MSSDPRVPGASEPGCIHFFGPDAPAGVPPGLEVLGGKGINLVELTRAKFPVPPGFVITTKAYQDFVAHHHLQAPILAIVSGLNPDDTETLESDSAKIRALFGQCEIPKAMAEEICAAYARLKAAGGERVAVRSSATAEDLPEASFAGQQDTYLNIRGEEPLLKAVRSCWASLWTARAIGYRAKQEIPSEGVALAVVVQKMVMAEAAGIMFTANPVTGARDEIVINAAWGLGEAIVGGHVTPDTIVVEKRTGKVREVTVSEKTVMTAAGADGTAESEISDHRRHARVLEDCHANRLALIGREVEAHYKSPQDIEWCLAGGEFFLVQARPITALPPEPVTQEELDQARQDEIAQLRKRAEGRKKVVWAIHNLAETLAAPTPLTWDIVSRFMSGSGGWGRLYKDLGYFPSERVEKEGFLDLVAGRPYADLERAAELFFDQFPLEYDLATATGDGNPLDAPPGKFNFERAGGGFLLRLPLYIVKMIRSGRKLKKLARKYLDVFEKQILPGFLERVKHARAQDLAKLSEGELLRELDEREALLNHMGCESGKASFIAADYHGRLTATLEDILGKKAGQEFTTRLIMGLDGDMTVEQNCDLHRVAQGQMTLEAFLDKHGHRAAGEFELAEPRWSEDPAYLKSQVQNYKKAHAGKTPEPIETHARNKAARVKVEKTLGKVLEEHGAASLEADIRDDLAGAQRYMPYRETGKYYFMMTMALVRSVLEELARRWHIGPDIYFLRREELAGFGSRRDECLSAVNKRKLRWQALQSLAVPEIITSEDPEAVGRVTELAVSADGVFAGTGVATGVSTGIARIVKSPKEAGNLGANYVLVCTSTDPGWTPLFVHARGVIVERGGMLSHGAIVARDFGIPAVVLKNATRLIPDGAEIRIDGNRGRVELVGAPAAAKES